MKKKKDKPLVIPVGKLTVQQMEDYGSTHLPDEVFQEGVVPRVSPAELLCFFRERIALAAHKIEVKLNGLEEEWLSRLLDAYMRADTFHNRQLSSPSSHKGFEPGTLVHLYAKAKEATDPAERKGYFYELARTALMTVGLYREKVFKTMGNGGLDYYHGQSKGGFANVASMENSLFLLKVARRVEDYSEVLHTFNDHPKPRDPRLIDPDFDDRGPANLH